MSRAELLLGQEISPELARIDCARFDVEVIAENKGYEVWMSQQTGAELFFDLLKHVSPTRYPESDSELFKSLQQVTRLIDRQPTEGASIVLRFCRGEAALVYSGSQLESLLVLQQITLNDTVKSLVPLIRREGGLSAQERNLLGEKQAELAAAFNRPLALAS